MKNATDIKKLRQDTRECMEKFVAWDTVVDFTKIKKGGVKIDEILFRL